MNLDKLRLVVFSKNRAAQLDLLLTSIREFVRHPNDVYVIYTADNTLFEAGYERVISLHQRVHFRKESVWGGFRAALEKTIEPDQRYRLTGMMADDDLFCRRLTLSEDRIRRFLESDDIETISLRLGTNLNYSYVVNLPMSPPSHIDQHGVYERAGCHLDWAYPRGVCCDLFPSDRLYEQITRINQYSNPNELEAHWTCGDSIADLRPRVMVLEHPVLVNIPDNRVQNTFMNRSEDHSVEHLNREFLSGKRLCLSVASQGPWLSCHEPRELLFQVQHRSAPAKRLFRCEGSCFSHGGENKGYSTHGKESKLLRWTNNERSEGTFFVNHAVKTGLKAKLQEPKYAWLLESPAIIGDLIEDVASDPDKYANSYDALFTYDRKLVTLNGKFKWVPAMGYWVKTPKLRNKTELISILASDKNWLPGHRTRLDLINQMPASIPRYGRGFSQVETVEEALSDYMFSVAIENAVSPGYFTEKILNCFACGTVPIYLGDPDIGDHFNTDGIIKLTSPADTEVSQELYREMLPAIEDNLQRVRNYELVEDFIIRNYLA